MKLTRTYEFQAAHLLPRVAVTHKCSQLHGHSYRVSVTIEGPVDTGTGMVIDFADVDAVVGSVITSELDHRYLNEVDGLENPTTENLAMWLWERLQETLPLLGSVEVAETSSSAAIYDGS